MSGLEISDVIHRFDRIRRSSPTVAKELDRNQPNLPAYTGNPFTVCPFGRNGPRHMRAMIVSQAVVYRVVIAREILAMDVIDIPIAVIINPIHGIIGIRPDIAC